MDEILLGDLTRIPPTGYPFIDAFGRWCIRTADCSACGGEKQFCVQYATNAHFKDGIDISKTILKRTQNPIGITCGCYAKFHRQMAHIQHKITQRSHKRRG